MSIATPHAGASHHHAAPAPKNGFRDFLNGEFQTASGAVSGRSALIMVLTVPVCLAAAALAMTAIFTWLS